MDALSTLGILKKKWDIILFVAIAFALVTGVACKLFIKPVYRSSASLYFGRVTDEPSSLEKIISAQGNTNPLRAAASQLSLGSQLSDDYRELINFEVVTEGVQDELAKLGKWERNKFVAKAEMFKKSRIMKIIIDSGNPLFSQELANIYAKVFIDNVQQLIGVQNMQIIEEPALQLNPVFPKIPTSVAAAFIAGFTGTFMIFIFLKALDSTLNNAEEIKSAINIPVVGTVHKDYDTIIDKKHPLLFSNEETFEKDRTKITEDFRVFRVNIINNTHKNKDEGTVIAITSSQAKEGKTFCTTNIGAALAEAGYKVLLVDCDTGRNGLQKHFGNAEDKGLMNILSEEVEFEDVVKRNLNNSNMDILLCGNQKLNSANLMISPKFKSLMKNLKKQYDYAFLDVSTHLGTADIVSAGSSADSVFLLVKAGITEEEIAKKTVATFERAKLKISGVIINGLEEE